MKLPVVFERGDPVVFTRSYSFHSDYGYSDIPQGQIGIIVDTKYDMARNGLSDTINAYAIVAIVEEVIDKTIYLRIDLQAHQDLLKPSPPAQILYGNKK